MHRIDTPGSVSSQFSPGNPFASGGGVRGTVLGADWPNAVQEELAAVIEGEGLTLDKADNGQLLEALEAMFDRLLGRLFTFTATEDLSTGDGFLVRDVFGVVQADVLNTFEGTLIVRGRFTLPKVFAENFTKGDRLYWNHTNRELTTTASGAVSVGYADADAGTSTSTVSVVLAGPPNV